MIVCPKPQISVCKPDGLLGVLLYELLAGQPPFDAKTLVDAGLDAMRRVIREVDPPRPSHRIGTLSEAERTSVAERRRTDAGRLRTLLSGDVDWIVMRCLEKERARRYEAASALAVDIERHLENEPVLARPPSAAYRIGKFVRRHRTGVTAAVAVAVSVVAGLIAASTLLVRERAARARATAAEQAENRLRQQAETARVSETRRASRTSQALAEQLFQEGRSAEALAHLVRAARSDPQNFVIGPRLISALAYRRFALPIGPAIPDVDNAGYTKEGGRIWTYRTTDASARAVLDGNPNVRGPRFAMYPADGDLAIRDLARGDVLFSFRVQARCPSAETVDGQRLAIARADGTIVIYSTTTGRALLGPLAHGERLTSLQFSPDGRWLATGATAVKLWDTATGELRATLPHARNVPVITFSPDNRQIVTATGNNGQWRLWRVPEGEPLTPAHREPINLSSFVFSRDGSKLVMTDNDGARIIDLETGDTSGRQLRHDGPANVAAFSPNESLLATGGSDGTARLWQFPAGTLQRVFQHAGGVPGLSFTPDGRHHVTRSGDGGVRVWDVATGLAAQEPVTRPRVMTMQLAPNGREFLTVGEDRVVRRWPIAPTAIQPLHLRSEPDRLHLLVETGPAAWVLYRDRLEQFDLLSGRRIGQARPLPAPIDGGRLGPRAEIASVSAAGQLELWDLRGPAIRRRALDAYSVANARFSPDGRWLAAIPGDSLHIWDTQTARLIVGPVRGAGRFEFSPDGRRFAMVIQGRGVVLWDLRTGSQIGEPIRHDAFMGGIEFSRDGRWVATASTDGVVRLSDASNARPIGRPLIHRGLVNMVHFSRDSRRLLAGAALEARLWDVASATPAAAPLASGPDAQSADFSDDETRIVTMKRSGEVRIWESGMSVADPLRMAGRMSAGGLQLAGHLMIASRPAPRLGGHVEIWPLPPPTVAQPAPEWLLRLATAVAGGEIDGDAGFRDVALDSRVFDDLRRTLEKLAADAPFANWGRWFLADPATRPIAPGFKVTAAEAAQLAARAPGGRDPNP